MIFASVFPAFLPSIWIPARHAGLHITGISLSRKRRAVRIALSGSSDRAARAEKYSAMRLPRQEFPCWEPGISRGATAFAIPKNTSGNRIRLEHAGGRRVVPINEKYF